MTVIAMTREMGSQGKDVALQLVEQLNLRLVQHEVVDHVADKMHLGSGLVNRFLEGKANLLERWGIDESSMSLYTAGEVFDLAAHGNVLIRGWGAAHLLKSVDHVCCVRICAPLKTRAGVLMERIGIADEFVARREIESSDAAHDRTMTHLFHVDWKDALNYDIVMNTAHIPVADCVDIIKDLVARPAFQETQASRDQLQKLKIIADVRAALRSNRETRRLDSLVEISLDLDKGAVTLSGMVDSDEIKATAAARVIAVAGVSTVRNQLLVANRINHRA